QFTPPKLKSLDSNKEMLPDEKDKLNRLLFIAPRGFSKSTICSRFFPMWLAVLGKRKDIFIVSATMALAIENLRIIREELEANERLKKDFGEMKSDKWREDMIILNNGTIIRAKGQGFQIRGFRPDMIICDDLEDENIIYSKDQRAKLEHWFFRTLLPSLKPEQSLIYVGTKLHTQSLMSNLEKKPEFLARFYAAITNEESIWEDRWPLVSLRKLQRELGTYAFQAEYQNNPISLADQPIKPHYLQGVKIAHQGKVACLAVDPAISEKESSDYRAFALFERTDEGFKEVISDHGRWGMDEQVNRILDVYERYNKEFQILRVVFEEVGFQKVIRDVFMQRSKERGIYVPVSTAEMGAGKDKRPKDKMTRLLSVSHLFEQKLVEVSNPDLYDELLSFPTGDYDDLVDATVHSIYWLMHSRHGGAFRQKEKVKIPDSQDSFYVKEVRPGVFMTKVGEPELPKANSNFISYG
ncbi:MAG TPA: hypothetical protein ENI13_01955, partial [candidate division CPR3 bacterium]|nr:hypothetical protein [candidate division CPR3 bacterium]